MDNFYYKTSHCIDCWISTERDEVYDPETWSTYTQANGNVIEELGNDVIDIKGYQCPECITISNLYINSMPGYAEEADKRHEYVESKYPQDFEHFKSEILTQRKEQQ